MIWLRHRFENIVAILGLGASAATVAAFAGPLWWALDMTTHFRVQYFGGLLLAAVLMWVSRRRRLAVLFTVACLVNLGTIVPQYLPRAPGPAHAIEVTGSSGVPGVPLRLMQLNVLTENKRNDLVAAAIRHHDPDVLVLQEVNQAWIESLGEVLQAYPYTAVRTRRDNFGIAVFSRHPMDAEIVAIGPRPVPSVVARVAVEGVPLSLIATHPLPPSGAEGSRHRDEHLAALAEVVRGLDGPVVVIGDLNATPWSAPFRALLRETGLRDASRGRGVHATWPANLPPMRIPIDHCLHSPEIEILSESVGADVGSDHYPLIVDARIR